VAETWEGKLWAIQVKGYDPENQVPTSEIDFFISASSRPEFAHRLLISTGQVSKNTEYKLTHQEKSTAFLLCPQLFESPVDWLAFLDQSLHPLQTGT
jgi:predicted helicase